MLRSLLFSFSLVCLFTVPAISQTSSELTEADRQERQRHGLEDLTGPLKMVVVEESQFSAHQNAPKQYVEVGRIHAKTLIFNTEGKITEIIERGQQQFRCGTKFTEHKTFAELHDASGRKTGAIEKIYTTDGRLIGESIYEYDFTGQTRALRRAIYDSLGSIMFKWAYQFDDQGHEVERSTYGQFGLLSSRKEFIRNEKGLIIESLEYSSNDTLPVNRTVMAYEYDDNGHWVKCTYSKYVTENGESFLKPVRKDYRTITYYPPNAEKQSQ